MGCVVSRYRSSSRQVEYFGVSASGPSLSQVTAFVLLLLEELREMTHEALKYFLITDIKFIE